MAKYLTNVNRAIWWAKLELIHVLVAKLVTNKVNPVIDSIAWVRCDSANVLVLSFNSVPYSFKYVKYRNALNWE